ncbi:MAG: EamA family transporter [Actinomycetota bacterium]|nr:EamA family transporter [Actinomycetota bacterium]
MENRAYPYLLALITMFFWGIAPVFGKLGLAKVSPYIALVFRSLVVTVILLIVILVRGELRQLAAIDLKSATFIGLEGIMASLLGHFAYYYALKLGETSRVVPITSAFPIVTLAVAAIFLTEKITMVKGAGAALIIAGLLLLRW